MNLPDSPIHFVPRVITVGNMAGAGLFGAPGFVPYHVLRIMNRAIEQRGVQITPQEAPHVPLRT
jgi:hypothetical protein